MRTKFTIRPETFEDTEEVSHIVKRAFVDSPRGHHGEDVLVEKIRMSEGYIPELAMVALHEEAIVGHILLSRVYVQMGARRISSLLLAPVSVLPKFQSNGIGGQLIQAAHESAVNLGEQHVFLLGHATYYPRFGYEPSRNFGIVFPDGLDNDNCMAIELVTGSLNDIDGVLEYSQPFYEI